MMRSLLKSVSAALFACSLALVVLAIAATDGIAAPVACAKVSNGGDPPVSYCPGNGTCPGMTTCLRKDYTTEGGVLLYWLCECQ